MASSFVEDIRNPKSVPASGDLSAVQYYFHTFNSSGQLATSGAAERTFGILQNKPNAAGEAAQVCGIGDISLCKIGGTVTAGGYLETNASGQGIAQTTGIRVAQALQSGVANDLILVHFLGGSA
jgi:hypothetical protein